MLPTLILCGFAMLRISCIQNAVVAETNHTSQSEMTKHTNPHQLLSPSWMHMQEWPGERWVQKSQTIKQIGNYQELMCSTWSSAAYHPFGQLAVRNTTGTEDESEYVKVSFSDGWSFDLTVTHTVLENERTYPWYKPTDNEKHINTIVAITAARDIILFGTNCFTRSNKFSST